MNTQPAPTRWKVTTDLDRACDIIRAFRLCRPRDPVGAFTFPKDRRERQELADFVFDVADAHAARAVLDAPAGITVTWQPPHG